jgi:hypothetical protein
VGIKASLAEYEGFGDEVRRLMSDGRQNRSTVTRAHDPRQVQELYDVLAAHYASLVTVARDQMQDVGRTRDLDLMALTLDEYRQVCVTPWPLRTGRCTPGVLGP